MQSIIEAAQPYITAVVTAIIGLLATVILAYIARLRVKAEAWLVARTSSEQRDLLHKLAAEAYAWAEQQYGSGTGPDKLTFAVRYVLERIRLDKIGISAEDVTAAVQKAWVELDAKNRTNEGKVGEDAKG